MKAYRFVLKGAWLGDRSGEGTITVNGLTTKISVPGPMGGAGHGANPEELFLSAAASCYMITLAILLSNRQIPFKKIEIESEGNVVKDDSLSYDSVVHRPTIVLPKESEPYVARVKDYAFQADHFCMISRAARGNVSFRVEPTVIVE
jgi:peroxiredoxin-like protein